MGRHQIKFANVVRACRGQSTVEFAVVTAAFMAMVVTAGVLWRALSQGLFVDHALASASHHVEGVLGWVVDIFSY